MLLLFHITKTFLKMTSLILILLISYVTGSTRQNEGYNSDRIITDQHDNIHHIQMDDHDELRRINDLDSQHSEHSPDNNNVLSNSDISDVESVAAAQAAAAAAASLRGPYFDTSVSRNVTALVGKTASLVCRVKNLGNRTISWVRHRDIHLLTVGRSTYTSDQRFSCIHNPQTEEWILQVRYPQRRDSGIYECQVSTTPPIGHSMHLSVVEPITTVLGGPDIYINRGSTMNLTCIVKHSPEPPPFIFWTHNDESINYDSPRGGVSVITEKGDITVSYLLIQRAKGSDSGKYTCSPSNANSKTIVVHVLNGEHPAAMQHGGQLRLEYPISACLLSVLIVVLGT